MGAILWITLYHLDTKARYFLKFKTVLNFGNIVSGSRISQAKPKLSTKLPSDLSFHWILLASGTFVAIETYLPSELFVATGNVVANNEVCFKNEETTKTFYQKQGHGNKLLKKPRTSFVVNNRLLGFKTNY